MGHKAIEPHASHRHRRRPHAVTFARLTEVSPDLLAAHMSDPRMAAHMPLLTEPWDRGVAERFVAAKEACWQRDGLGHWAFLADGLYVGWGGFQKEGEEWDFGLVLRPAAFGLGALITRQALEFARADPRIPFVTFLLPPSRRNLGALTRLGARFEGEVVEAGAAFRKYRLETPCTRISYPKGAGDAPSSRRSGTAAIP
ncbi:GNAT family N-acetyltransferase [Albidovulum sediminicola]|uniref:GNAT family N-acetyltransferase n=1 Tax=Albidovulum sediminicola TaxID=2984331 RepID=A0ABT2Z6A1_9RHOB|nr:GNAT family N-acetyltransferase [Defluviimonas sp. WL0075]MCV2866646.1 GNAT family N-acetyltransferase [Defluviimonas sp. WL0075]